MRNTDHFSTTGDITIQPNDADVPYSFTFTIGTSATANDGSLPYGSSIDSYTLTAYKVDDGTDVTSDLISSSSESSNVITVLFNYPTTNGAGWYKLTFNLTLNTGAVFEKDFNRVYAENI